MNDVLLVVTKGMVINGLFIVLFSIIYGVFGAIHADLSIFTRPRLNPAVILPVK